VLPDPQGGDVEFDPLWQDAPGWGDEKDGIGE